MVVVAVLTIVMALAIPSLRNSRIAANESSTLSNMRSIGSINETYRNRFDSYAAALSDLPAAGFTESQIAVSGEKAGYSYSYARLGGDFILTANPIIAGTTGRRYFYLDSRGVLRFATNGTANGSSAPVQ
jgi:type II secretory pathway pseudopilin PulG